jgi:hypothetical protein
MKSPSQVSHEDIARRAHQIWEEAGRQDGSETLHWLQAERELSAGQQSFAAAKPDQGRSAEPAPSGKHQSEHAPHSTNYAHPGVTTDSLHHVRHR